MAIIRNKGTELRKVLADELRSMMEENRNIIYMEADLGGALGTGDLFSDFPGQAVNVGIMEANMVGAAAGMSVKGKIPFVALGRLLPEDVRIRLSYQAAIMVQMCVF